MSIHVKQKSQNIILEDNDYFDDIKLKKNKLSYSPNIHNIKTRSVKNINKNVKSINRINLNELPLVNNINESTISRSQTKYIRSLRKQLSELNYELNKMRNDKDIENYKKLEEHYIKKNKEMSQLKQDNNLLLFQIEDLNRKYKERNHKNNSHQNNSELTNSIKKKLIILRENKQNNLAKYYNVNNLSIISNTKNTTRSHFFDGVENINKNIELISNLRKELELYKDVDEENKKLKTQIEEKEIYLNKYKTKIHTLEFENKNLKNENIKSKEKYSKLLIDYSDLEKKNIDNEKKHKNLKNKIKDNKSFSILEKKKLDDFKDEIQEKENKINELNNDLNLKEKEIEELNNKINELIKNKKYEELKNKKEELDKKFEDILKKNSEFKNKLEETNKKFEELKKENEKGNKIENENKIILNN